MTKSQYYTHTLTIRGTYPTGHPYAGSTWVNSYGVNPQSMDWAAEVIEKRTEEGCECTLEPI